MKGIRRSLNKDRIGAPTPTFSTLSTSAYPSIPAPAKVPSPASANRPTAAPAPPKRVIRAITSYRARSNQELTFDQGDFFHVVSDDGGDDWFDAANPMTGARGLVPASCFQVLGRNVRETAQGTGAARKNNGGSGSGGPSPSGSSSGRQGQPSPSYGGSQQSGGGGSFSQQQQQQGRGGAYQNGGGGGQQGYVPTSSGPTQSSFMVPPTSPPLGSGQHLSSSSAGSKSSGGGRPPSQPTPKSQPLYGIVQYDFVAERADELNAKRGEPIIVIAQSNHEWFVAKPIGRLGGPGLIPVAFVEIQDMTTGKPVENVEELIRSAVVPKVEEWKKMTADYKSASIPLGRFDFAEGAAPAPSAGAQKSFTGAAGGSQGAGSSSRDPQYDVGGSNGTMRQEAYPNQEQQQDQQQYDDQQQQGDYDEYGDQPSYDFAAARRQYGLVTSASVESFHQEEGSFWFHVRAYFSTGASLVLYRLYQDFYDFQIALMDEFPVEAGRVPPGGEGSGRPLERILPMMPGPTDYEDENVCSSRVQDLSTYLADLCALPEHLRGAGLMYEFFIPRAGDVEVATGNGLGDTPGGGRDERQPSMDGQYGDVVEYLDSMEGQDKRGTSGEIPDVGGLNINDGQEEDFDTYRPQQQGRQSGGSKTSSTRHSNSRGSNPYADGEPRSSFLSAEWWY